MRWPCTALLKLGSCSMLLKDQHLLSSITMGQWLHPPCQAVTLTPILPHHRNELSWEHLCEC